MQATAIEQQCVQAAPFAATCAHLKEHLAYLDLVVGMPDEDGWIAAMDLAAAAAPERAEIMRRIAAANQTQDRHVVAMWFWNAYTWPVLMGSVLSYVLERRVPDLAPANIMLHWNDAGMTDGAAFRSGHFVALPDDPAVDDEDCTIVPDRDALHAVLVEQITQHYVPPMLDMLAAHSPLGTRALWATVADRCAGTVIQTVTELGTDTCRHEVAALLRDAPLHGTTGVLAVEHDGREAFFLRRGGCCYSYKLPQYGYCATCPLLPIEERVQRLRTQLTQTMEQEG
jgi:ferric iron reductase protein FhuF